MRKLHEIFARAFDPVFAIDGERRVVYQNDAFARIFSRPNSSLLGRACHEVIRANCDRVASCVVCNPDCPVGKSLLQGKPVGDFDLAVPRRDGKSLLLNVCAFPVLESNPLAAVFIMRPVSAMEKGAIPPTAAPSDDKNNQPPPKLTLREQQILRMLAYDISIRNLAASLNISYVTARNHIRNIFAKLGVHNRAAAIGLAFRCNLL